MRKLVAAVVGESFDTQETFLGSWCRAARCQDGVSQGNLNGFAVEFLGKIDGLFDGFLGFAGKTDDEVAVDFDANFAAVLHEGAAHFDGRALLDVLQNLRIAGFEANDEQAAPPSAMAFSVS